VTGLIVFGASDLLFVMAAGLVGVLLLLEHGRDRLHLACAAAIGLVLVFAFILVAATLHTDPRPFVQNPALRPLISHAADNGFPSDHSAAAGLIATLVALRNPRCGAIFAVAAVLVAWSRVAAHVHHVQDVAAGLALGALAAAIGAHLATAAVRRLAARSRHTPSLTGR
jgi:undecaprenyl-diphosphatase